MNERIKTLRNTLGLTQQEFADRIKVKRNTVATYEMGRSTPSDSAIALMCSTFNVNFEWLQFGSGDMFKDDNGDAQAIVDSVMTGDNEFVKEILVKLSKLSEEHWQQLKEIFEELTKE